MISVHRYSMVDLAKVVGVYGFDTFYIAYGTKFLSACIYLFIFHYFKERY